MDKRKFKRLAIKSLEIKPEKEEDPLIEEIREIIRRWAKVNDVTELTYNGDENSLADIFRNTISFNHVLDLEDGCSYLVTELCE